jgi:hypothetical protein
MEPKGFMGYSKKGNACELNIEGMSNNPSTTQTKIIEPMVFADYSK